MRNYWNLIKTRLNKICQRISLKISLILTKSLFKNVEIDLNNSQLFYRSKLIRKVLNLLRCKLVGNQSEWIQTKFLNLDKSKRNFQSDSIRTIPTSDWVSLKTGIHFPPMCIKGDWKMFCESVRNGFNWDQIGQNQAELNPIWNLHQDSPSFTFIFFNEEEMKQGYPFRWNRMIEGFMYTNKADSYGKRY